MNDFLWNFPSQMPEVSEESNAKPTDLGWGDDNFLMLEVREETTSQIERAS